NIYILCYEYKSLVQVTNQFFSVKSHEVIFELINADADFLIGKINIAYSCCRSLSCLFSCLSRSGLFLCRCLSGLCFCLCCSGLRCCSRLFCVAGASGQRKGHHGSQRNSCCFLCHSHCFESSHSKFFTCCLRHFPLTATPL